MKIHITQESIDHGEPGTSDHCAIAIELQKLLPGVQIEVKHSCLIFRKYGIEYVTPLPIPARRFIWRFDWWPGPTFPATLDLEIPECLLSEKPLQEPGSKVLCEGSLVLPKVVAPRKVEVLQ